MRRVLFIGAMVLAAVGSAFSTTFSSCGTAGLQPQQSLTQQLQHIRDAYNLAAQKACAERGVNCTLFRFTSKQLTDTTRLHYLVLKVEDRVSENQFGFPRASEGQFHCIGIARVLKKPYSSEASVGQEPALLIHGSQHTFRSQFAPALSDDPGIASWLADQGIDVWGVDLRYVFVPSLTTDFRFMREWNFKAMTDDVRLAARIARRARHPEGGDPGKTLHLVGHSVGGALVFSVANTEAVLPPMDRDIGDMIPIDTIYKLDPSQPGLQAAADKACDAKKLYRTPLEIGVYQDDNGYHQRAIGEAARSNGDGLSGIQFSGTPWMNPNIFSPMLTNKQLAMKAACDPWFPGFPGHTVACTRDFRGVPQDAPFSSTERIFDDMANLVPFRPNSLMADYYGIACGGKAEAEYSNNLEQVSIPSYYIGLRGGFGALGASSNSLIAGPTKMDLIPLAPDGPQNDFGHVEPFIGKEAYRLSVWQPILTWITAHPRPE